MTFRKANRQGVGFERRFIGGWGASSMMSSSASAAAAGADEATDWADAASVTRPLATARAASEAGRRDRSVTNEPAGASVVDMAGAGVGGGENQAAEGRQATKPAGPGPLLTGAA